MCGIAGWLEDDIDTSRISKSLRKVVDSMHHRGPDYNNVQIVSDYPAVVLGHSRLAIIDLSLAGNQPMTDKVSGNTIVFNGEIYNFKILRKELEALGHNFITHSDTEVILKSYCEWGFDCCKRFKGIFAFAIWDKQNQKLFMARDQVGVKPFYYFVSDGMFIFASEVRALLASDVIPRKLDHAGLDSFMAYGSVQEPLTIFGSTKRIIIYFQKIWSQPILFIIK